MTPGYNGELQQTFFIQYRQTGEKSWQTIWVSDPNNGEPLLQSIEDLLPATDYVVTVFASNDEGNSTVSDMIPFSTAQGKHSIDKHLFVSNISKMYSSRYLVCLYNADARKTIVNAFKTHRSKRFSTNVFRSSFLKLNMY